MPSSSSSLLSLFFFCLKKNRLHFLDSPGFISLNKRYFFQFPLGKKKPLLLFKIL